MEFFSLAQWVGYAAFVLGIAAFLQTSDRRLKFLNATETLALAAHFALLDNPAAAVSAVVSCIRSLLAMRYRSPWLAVSIVAINVALGAGLVTNGFGWLPVIGSSVTTLAVFLLEGVRMRLAILVATLLWLANNIVSGSIGGTALETLIAIANTSTIVRMVWGRRG